MIMRKFLFSLVFSARSLVSLASIFYVGVSNYPSEGTTRKMAKDQNPTIPEPKVLLRNARWHIFGKIQRGNFPAYVSRILGVVHDKLIQPIIDGTSVDYGPNPSPAGENFAVIPLINVAYQTSFGSVTKRFPLRTISIAHGIMMLPGRIK